MKEFKGKSLLVLFALVTLSVSVSVYAAIVYNQLAIPATVTITPQPTTYKDIWTGPVSIAFGTVVAGNSSDIRPLTIQNTDTVAHTLNLVETGLPSGCTLHIYSNSGATTPYTPTSIAAGQTLTVYMVLSVAGTVTPASPSFQVVASAG